MKMSSMIPDKAHGISRWDLLQAWAALNWLERNNKTVFKEAAKAIDLTDKQLSESVKYFGYGVSLWNPNAKRTPEPVEETAEDDDLTH